MAAAGAQLWCTKLTHTTGVRLLCKVVPNSKKAGVFDTSACSETLRIRLTAPARDNEANQALIAFLSAELQVRKQAVNIAHGLKSAQKVVDVFADLTPEFCFNKLLNSQLS